MSTAVMAPKELRSDLGDFSSIICFKAVVTGVEEALGEKAAMIALVAAGRTRGKQLAAELGLAQVDATPENMPKVAEALDGAIGAAGTRLCAVDKIEMTADGKPRVYCRETICSSGEPQGSPRKLSYTMGAIQGAMEAVLGKRLRGSQVESVLRGSSHDVIEFDVIG